MEPPAAVVALPPFRVVFVLGGPGSGKGTQCARVVSKYGWVHLSAGDLLRAARKDPSSTQGELINEYIKEGKIVPVEITLGLIRSAMYASGSKDFLIDGFPRNLDNDDGWLREMTACSTVASLLYLETTEEVMQERILGRAAAVLAEGGELRTDDNLESIQKRQTARFRTYVAETMPIIEKYERDACVTRVDSTPSSDDVFAEVCKLFDSLTR
ncbi:adenylate kinase-domain-containing protein [Pelagophyceae sp. CCMP2097]|nr:adenylate kinase-domain-containing protein [Pelagophyceae sp. CCMP2097]